MKNLLLLILLSTCAVSRAETNPADDVIDKAIAAMGGLDKIHAIQSVVLRGFHYEGSYPQEGVQHHSSNGVLVRMRPHYRLVGCRPEIPECSGQWGRIVESFDGQLGWELNWPKQRLVRTINKAEQALHCGSEFDPLFVDYKQRGFTATYLGAKKMLGTDTVAVRIDEQGCSSTTYFFDPKTYEQLMTQITVPIHARGDRVESVAIYKEFKTVNGVRFPSRTEEINPATGDVLNGMELESITANTLSDPAIFSAPPVHPTGITAVVLDMLHTADTASADDMMKLYSSFRATPEGKQADVVYDMNWLGFELLKVDKYDHARAVFRQIIAQNPTSADAYSSLGEAYLQQGDIANAIAAYQKALDLGSKSEDVKRKLARLRSQ
ncbi:MAG TPA: tetratricopeptide repeat protein [Acidobacteriaceae bacterium]|jgi:tetratricopeptide (TPR) repeat protein|nr:tetratricopeptide repeat protein [Acidobacteriaceae bacterium]